MAKKIHYLSFLLTLLMVSSSVYAQTDLTGATVTLDPSSYDYDGTAHCPKVSSIRKGRYRYNTLVEGTDYDLSYSDNINAGEATATLTFKGNYTGTTTKIFTINPIDLTADKSVEMKLDNDLFVSDGTEKTPDVNVWYGDKKFVSGVDYDLTYENNINIGTATAIVTFKGNYQGRRNAPFYIIDPEKPIDPEAKDVDINETNFPDENFRRWLNSQSFGSDGRLTLGEIYFTSTIIVKNKNIQSLKGIEFFTSLTILYCGGNQLTSLDVSKNAELQYLHCDNNQLSSLDLSQNKGLIALECFNNQLSSLNISGCTGLTRLYCYKNQIKGAAMEELIANLPTVSEGRMNVLYNDYSANENEGNKVTVAQIASIRDKGWTPYYYASSWKEYFVPSSVIDISEANFPDKKFRAYLSGQSYIFDGILTDEDIANIKDLNVVGVGIENLKGIEFFTELTSLNCSKNLLNSLDVSKNTVLESLTCSENRLTSLDLSKNTALKTLYCNNNQLESIVLFEENALKELVCYCNQLKDDALTLLIDKLPNVSNCSILFKYNENEDNVMIFEQAAAAKVKGWTPMYFDGNDWHIYYGIEPIILHGDANGDGEIGMPDVMFIVNYILGTPAETFNADAADVNGDGEIGMSDVMYIVQYILNGLYPSGGMFYLGTVQPTKDNYRSLPGVMTSYVSILDAVGNNVAVSAGETLYMLCPVSWMEDQSIALEDEKGNTISFSSIEQVFISEKEYYIFTTKTLDAPCNVRLKSISITENSVAAIIDSDPDVKIYSEALKLTNLNVIMEKCEDYEYRNKYIKYRSNFWAAEAIATGSRSKEYVFYPEHRYYGFTAFMVKDETLEKYNSVLTNHQFNASGNIDENILALAELASKYYTTSVPYTSTDYANPEHPLYQFMAYHILDRYVQGYNYLTVREDAGINKDIVNPTDWYTTCLPHSMIKVEHGGTLGHYYINRNLNDKSSIEGVHVQPTVEVQDNHAANGIYFYIDDILTFDTNTIDNVFNTRIRMDFSTIFPEIMTNGIRMNGPSITSSNAGNNYRFPQGYLSGVTLNNEETRLIYWYPRSGYYSMNGDEVNAQNLFDITFTLPPVPFTGDWQIRLGFAPMNAVNDGADYRGVAQIYFDDDDEGTIVDFSRTLSDVYGISASEWSYMNYSEIRQDKEKRLEDFNILKSQGYYRAPHSLFNSSNGQVSGMYNTLSQLRNAARVVLCTVHIEAGKAHTIRIKNIEQGRDAKNKEAMLDYLELVPKSVYEITEGDNVEDDL